MARAQPPAQQAHPVRINPTTTVVARPNHGGIVITQHRPNGAEVVVRRSVVGNGRPSVVAYQRRVDPTTHAETRVFLDGHRVTVARDSVTFSAPRHLTVTAHRDGLHDAFLPDGRRFYHEAFATEHGARVLQRTVFATIAAGTVVALGVPLVETFGVVPYHGVVIYPYYPVVYDPVFYPFFVSPFATPVVVGPACAFCPPPVVAFAQPMQAYSDPTDLMTDMQIADAMQDGEDQLPPPSSPPPPDADVQALQDQVASLQQEVDAQAQTNDELQAALQQQGDQNAALQSQVASQQQQSVPPAPIPVAADVRQQIKKEVKDDIALHQQKKPLSVPEIAASADAQNYIFQVSDILDATTDSGEECALTGGDLVKFDQVPGDNDLAAAMKVVTSKPGSCQAGSVIQASVADLQDMLNGFSERLDANMKKVHDQYASTSNSGKTVTP